MFEWRNSQLAERRASRVLFLFPSNELQHPVGKTARFLHFTRSQQHPPEMGRWEFKPPYVNILQDVDIYTNSSFIIIIFIICNIGFFLSRLTPLIFLIFDVPH